MLDLSLMCFLEENLLLAFLDFVLGFLESSLQLKYLLLTCFTSFAVFLFHLLDSLLIKLLFKLYLRKHILLDLLSPFHGFFSDAVYTFMVLSDVDLLIFVQKSVISQFLASSDLLLRKFIFEEHELGFRFLFSILIEQIPWNETTWNVFSLLSQGCFSFFTL